MGEEIRESGAHLAFECGRFNEWREKLGEVAEWKDLDPYIPVGKGEDERDGVRELFYEIEKHLLERRRAG
jgi:hypothetical protein